MVCTYKYILHIFCNTHLAFPKPPSLFPSLSLPPPLRCKRPWCLFEGLPRHISMANLACYACASIAKSSSFIVMTHKARPKHKCLSAIEPPWMTENMSLCYKKKRSGFTLIGLRCLPTLRPLWWSSPEQMYQIVTLWLKYVTISFYRLWEINYFLTSFVSSEYSTGWKDHCWITWKRGTCKKSCRKSTWDFHQLPVNTGFSEQKREKNHQPHSALPRFPQRWREFTSSFAQKSMITWAHGTKRGGTHIYSDQTGWQTSPWGMPSSTHS